MNKYESDLRQLGVEAYLNPGRTSARRFAHIPGLGS